MKAYNLVRHCITGYLMIVNNVSSPHFKAKMKEWLDIISLIYFAYPTYLYTHKLFCIIIVNIKQLNNKRHIYFLFTIHLYILYCSYIEYSSAIIWIVLSSV